MNGTPANIFMVGLTADNAGSAGEPTIVMVPSRRSSAYMSVSESRH